MPSSARDEAERLVAAVMAVADTAGLGGFAHSVRDAVGRVAGSSSGPAGESQPRTAEEPAAENPAAQNPAAAGQRGSAAASGHQAVGGRATAGSGHQAGGGRATAGSGHQAARGWATGSAECCVCPVCQAIAAARNPSPATAVRLATSAGDIATGLAGLMRGLSGLAGDRSKRPASRAPRPAPAPSPDEAWSTATRRADPSGEFPTNPTNPENRSDDPWAAASAAGAAAAEEERAAARRAAAEKARAAAAEAAQRVAEAAAAAEAAKARAAKQAGDAIGDTAAGGGRSPRTPRRFDVWAAATAEAGVADVARPPTVDHDGLDHDGVEKDDPGDAERDEATGDGTAS